MLTGPLFIGDVDTGQLTGLPPTPASGECPEVGTPLGFACLEWLSAAGQFLRTAAILEARGDSPPRIFLIDTRGTLVVLDGESKAELANVTVGVSSSSSFRRPLLLAELDGDPGLEVVTGSDVGHEKGVQILEWNGSALNPEWNTSGLVPAMTWLDIGDLDLDGTLEILVLGSSLDVIGFNSSSLTYELERRMFGVPAREIRIGEVDGDAYPEVVGAGFTGLWVLDGQTLQVEWSIPHTSEPRLVASNGVALGNMDGVPGNEIVVGGRDDWVIVDPLTRKVTDSIPRESFGLSASIADVDLDGTEEFLGTVNDDLDYSGGDGMGYLEVYGAEDRVLRWRSPNLSRGVPDSGTQQVLSGNVDSDPRVEVLVTTQASVFQFEVFEHAPRNAAPVPLVSAVAGPEGNALLLDASGSVDPNGDSLQFRWDLDGDGTWDTPYSTDPFARYAWGDDYSGTTVVEVTDGNDTATATAAVTVSNVPPALGSIDVRAHAGEASLRLRIAGEKFHDVTATVFRNGVAIASGSVVRRPGSPDDQLLDLGPVTSADIVEVTYTPLDDPVNGRVWGATPAWLILTQDGVETPLHHTFNARHEDTWAWRVDLSAVLPPSGVDLELTATDPGSDDLTVTIDWGDGTVETQTFLNDPAAGPDPYPSPDVNPRAITATATHAYAMAGTYVITVMVEDDDGGVSTMAVSVTL